MAGWYKLDETDAFNLAEIQNSFNDKRSRHKRLRMLNYLWSKINSKGYPCPYFCVGRRTIAEKCDVSEGSAKKFIEYLEENGWVVKVGREQAGKTPRRTFWWIAETAGFSTSGHQLVPTTGNQLVPTPGHQRETVSTNGGSETTLDGAQYPSLNPTTCDHVQSTEYSQIAVDPVHSAIAEDGPLYSGASDSGGGKKKPKRSHREEALAWYRENGYPDPPVIPPPPGGEF